MTKRYGMPSKVVKNKNKKASIVSEWNKIERNFAARNTNLKKGQISDREMLILLRAAPKTQANLDMLKRLISK